ncbi:hypothetical protein DL121_13375 [Salmonella enterica subsp. enterica]|nr:hypothetical protein [Salmonella enterica subsp. enterica]
MLPLIQNVYDFSEIYKIAINQFHSICYSIEHIYQYSIDITMKYYRSLRCAKKAFFQGIYIRELQINYWVLNYFDRILKVSFLFYNT